MADGSATPAISKQKFVEVPPVVMHNDFYLNLGIPTGWADEETLRDFAEQMAAWGRATLGFARHRGDVDDDPPDALSNVLGAAEFLLQLSAGLTAVANEAGMKEVRHG